jgi:D-lyxose ketol-isomerase
MLKKAGLVVTRREVSTIEAADCGLGRFEEIGLGVLVYVNTQRCCAKELALWPRQTFPEHRHGPVSATNQGKEETFRCRWGLVYLYVPGPETRRPRARLPKGRESVFTVRHEVVLRPGDQYTLPPNTLHWFQAGPKGAVVSEFSTTSIDELDVFTDPEVQRITEVADRSWRPPDVAKRAAPGRSTARRYPSGSGGERG